MTRPLDKSLACPEPPRMTPRNPLRAGLASRLKDRIGSIFSRWLAMPEETLPAWRERISTAVFFCSTVMGVIPLISSLKWGLNNERWALSACYLAFYAWLLSITFFRRWPYSIRAWSGVAIYFLLGVASLVQLGPVGSGRNWLFASALLSSLLLGVWQSIAVLACIAGVLFTFQVLLESGRLVWPLLEANSVQTWTATSVTLMFLCSAITISLAVLVGSLGRALNKEKDASQHLQEAHRELQHHKDHLEALVGERTADLGKANDELKAEVESRKQAVNALLHLASGVAHNFNNVLMAGSSNAQSAQILLRQQSPDIARIDMHMENVVRSSEVGREVAKRLSRFVAGKRAVQDQLQCVDVGDVLAKIENIAQGTWFHQIRQGALVVRVAGEPDLFVLGVAGEIVEVLLNLVKNSVEAMQGQGVVTITAGRAGDKVRITVADEGPGLAREVSSRLFKPFVTTKGRTGLGLGLAISRDIVLALGGDLVCEESAGRGAAFSVSLPASARPALPPRAGPPSEPRPLHILLVEDEALVAMGLQTILTSAGHRVVWASGLAQAREALREAVPDVVLCDLNLPDGPGWELARDAFTARHSRQGRRVAFVVLTGFDIDTLDELPDGTPQPVAVLNKPIDRAALLKVLAKVT